MPACGFQLSAGRRQRPPGAGGELLLEAWCFDGFCLSPTEERWQPTASPQRQPTAPARQSPRPTLETVGDGQTGPAAAGLTEEAWPALEIQCASPRAEATGPAAGGQSPDWQGWDQLGFPAALGAKNGELALLQEQGNPTCSLTLPREKPAPHTGGDAPAEDRHCRTSAGGAQSWGLPAAQLTPQAWGCTCPLAFAALGNRFSPFFRFSFPTTEAQKPASNQNHQNTPQNPSKIP